MKKLLSFVIAFALIVMLAGCEETQSINEYEVLTEYLETDAPWNVNQGSWIVDAATAQASLADYFIVDLRADTVYARGHIAGAQNVALSQVVGYVETNNTSGDPVLVVCYTGQSASYAVSLLRLLGHDAKTLKFGMSAWNGDFDAWSGNTSNAYAAQFVETDAPALPSYDPPELDTGEDTGVDILKARVDAVVAEGFKGVSASDVFANPTAFQVMNYWAVTDYDNYGHIPGAYQLTPETLTTDANLPALNPDEVNVIYCWTGQTSALVMAYLRVLGYDAVSLKFGANSMIYDELTAHKWTSSGSYTYESN